MTQRVPFMEQIAEMDSCPLWKVGSIDPRRGVIAMISLRMTSVQDLVLTAVLTATWEERFVGIVTAKFNFGDKIVVFLSSMGIVIFSR